MDRLGINPGFLLAQIVNFVLVALILYFLVWRRLVRILETRRERIAKGLEDARAAELALANAERDAQKLLDQRRVEANKLVEESRGRGDEQVKIMLDEARREAEAIRQRSRTDAEEERNAILGEVRTQVAQIAVAAAERLIGQSLLDQTRAQRVIDEFFTDVPTEARSLGATIEVVSALPLTDAEKNRIRTETGAQNVTFRVDPNILGGLVLRSGDKVVDGSVRNSLGSLASQMF